MTCPSCQAEATGKFCANCGAPLAGATCGACNAPLSPGARFCHRCGTPAGAAPREAPRSIASALPWAVAAIALVAVVALVAGQQFGRRGQADNAAAAEADRAGGASVTPAGRPPDISNLSPAEAAIRLYNRVMSAHERGQQDTVQLFAPMAIAAYQMIPDMNLDHRYDLGRLAAVSGDEQLARAEADTILAKHPNHLLGLILAANAARMRKDAAAERKFQQQLVASAGGERAKQLAEYVTHENDINLALDQARRP